MRKVNLIIGLFLSSLLASNLVAVGTGQEDEFTKMIEQVNKSKLEYQKELKNLNEKEKRSDKDFVISELKKDKVIEDLKIQILNLDKARKDINIGINEISELKSYLEDVVAKIVYYEYYEPLMNTKVSILRNNDVLKIGTYNKVEISKNDIYKAISLVNLKVNKKYELKSKIAYYNKILSSTSLKSLQRTIDNKIEFLPFIYMPETVDPQEKVKINIGDIFFGNYKIENITDNNIIVSYIE